MGTEKGGRPPPFFHFPEKGRAGGQVILETHKAGRAGGQVNIEAYKAGRAGGQAIAQKQGGRPGS